MQLHPTLRTSFTLIAAAGAIACSACTAMSDEPLASGTNNDILVAQSTNAPPTPSQPTQTVKVEVAPPAEAIAEEMASDQLMTPWRHYVDGQLIVMYQDGHRSAAARAANQKIGAKVIQAFPVMRGALVSLPPGMSVPEAVAQFQALPGVINVSPNAVATEPDTVAMH